MKTLPFMTRIAAGTTLTAAALATGVLPMPAVAGGTCGSGYGSDSSASNQHHEPSILETAISADTFSTLVAAVQAAGLVEALSGDGPFTVLAPTNEAFAALPAGTIDELLKPENKELLTQILLYHVIPGEVDAAHLAEVDQAHTLAEQDVTVTATESGLSINNAVVVTADIDCSNGTIHVIDRVLLPTDGGQQAASH